MMMRVITTVALFFSYFVYGINFYIVGPTLVDLGRLFGTDMERISLVYTTRAAGYTIGSLSGFLFKFLNRQLMFVSFVTIMGLTLILSPFCRPSMTSLYSLFALNGFSIGSFDTAINVWILELWKADSGPYMQALHFTYACGSFVAPLIAEPFLHTTNTTGDDVIHIPYLIGGTATLSAAVIVAVLYCVEPYRKTPKEKLNYTAAATNSKKNNILLVTLGCLYLTIFVAVEQTHLQFLPAFAVRNGYTPQQSAFVTSAAAAAFAVGRGVAIPLAVKLRPATILYTNHALMLLGSVVLYCDSRSDWSMYGGNVLLGAGFSSVYASIYAFIEQHVTVTNRIGSVFVFSGGITVSLSPSLIGAFLMETPEILVLFNFFGAFLCLLIWILMTQIIK